MPTMTKEMFLELEHDPVKLTEQILNKRADAEFTRILYEHNYIYERAFRIGNHLGSPFIFRNSFDLKPSIIEGDTVKANVKLIEYIPTK